MSETKVVGQYYRSRDGKTIHLPPCPAMGKAVRWDYAAVMSLHEVADAVNRTEGLRLCCRCWPSGALDGAR